MSLKQYQAFLKAAELHSVSAAAEALGVTQSALTQAIGALEKQFARGHAAHTGGAARV